MAIAYLIPPDRDESEEMNQLLLDLYTVLQQAIRNAQNTSRNHRLPRRADERVTLVDSDLSRMPLPDLVLSAVEQLPSTPQVTVSAPSSPTRDAAFQFPECSGESSAPLPSPRPRPRPRRRRVASEGAGSGDKTAFETICVNCGHFTQAINEAQWENMGANLRTIADDFHASKTKVPENEKTSLSAMSPTYTSPSNTTSTTDGSLSVTILAPLRETLCATVALYLGWRLVCRFR